MYISYNKRSTGTDYVILFDSKEEIIKLLRKGRINTRFHPTISFLPERNNKGIAATVSVRDEIALDTKVRPASFELDTDTLVRVLLYHAQSIAYNSRMNELYVCVNADEKAPQMPLEEQLTQFDFFQARERNQRG
jgi:hypothetical protein